MAFQPYDPARAALLQRRKSLVLSLILLVALLAGQAFLLRWWIARDTRPPAWDQSIHLEIAQDLKEGLAHGDWGPFWHPVPKPGMPAFPPLYHLALQSVMGGAHPEQGALWVNFAYLALLAFCVFGLVFEFRSDTAAAFVAASFVLAPGVQELLLTQLVDLPVLAFSAAAYWAFLRSDDFWHWLPSLAFGVLFALGILHKWSFFAYMLPVFFIWPQALLQDRSRKPALAAFVLAVVLSAPWYLANWPMMLPRLFQATADFAVPVWRGAAFLLYFFNSVEALGPALFLMGWVGLLVAQYQRHEEKSWLVNLWVTSSYVFWAIVPNRQMRFLMPGLPGLAVAACGSVPAAALWALFVFQGVQAANYFGGYFGPIHLGGGAFSMALAPNNPPRREDWKVDEILKEAERRRDPAEPVANVTLIGNHPRFNGPLFTWRARAAGLKGVRMRGVNRRLCEFSQFVVLKRGDLGPESVTGGLKEAAAVVEDPKGWFARAYEPVGKWPLPDGTEAALFARRKLQAAPITSRAPIRIDTSEGKVFSAVNLLIDLGRWDAGAGVYPKVKLKADSIKVRGLTAENVVVELEDLSLVAVDPASPWSDVRFLKLKKLTLVSAQVSEASLSAFLRERLKGFQVGAIRLDGTANIEGQLRGFPLGAELGIELRKNPRALALRLVSLKLGPNPIPTGALNRIKELTVSLEPNPETPFEIVLPGLTLKDGRLSVP